MNPDLQAPCSTHPESAAVARCARCGRPVCETCRIDSLAAEAVFCSETCIDAWRRVESGEGTVGNETLRAGADHPIRTGLGLWWRSLGPLAVAILPVAVAAAPVAWLFGRAVDEAEAAGPGATPALLPLLLVALLAAYGVAVVGTLLSQRHTGLARGNAWARAATRFLPWAGTWLLLSLATLAGYIALIVPGIYLGLRLFWADEYALVHDRGPIAALRGSWRLTRDEVGNIFVFQAILGVAAYAMFLPAVVLITIAFVGLEAIGLGGSGGIGPLDGFVLTFFGLLAYGAFHGPELAKFYGMRAIAAERPRDPEIAVE